MAAANCGISIFTLASCCCHVAASELCRIKLRLFTRRKRKRNPIPFGFGFLI